MWRFFFAADTNELNYQLEFLDRKQKKVSEQFLWPHDKSFSSLTKLTYHFEFSIYC